MGDHDPIAPLVARDRIVFAQLGQSLDGRIATESGHSHYVNGDEAITHLHRLRAVADAVVVGAGTVAADDPRLTVRRCAGTNPVRVVIDPRGRLSPDHAVFTDGAAPTLVVRADGVGGPVPDGVEALGVASDAGGVSPAALLGALRTRGLQRIFVEGGGETVSRFVAARLVDRLHLLVAPLLIGSGPWGLRLPGVERLDQAIRPPTTVHRLGTDVLFDCNLRG